MYISEMCIVCCVIESRRPYLQKKLDNYNSDYCRLAELPIAHTYDTDTRPLLQHVVKKVSAFAVSPTRSHSKSTVGIYGATSVKAS